MDFNSALFKTIFTTIQSKALELIQVLIAQNPIIINFLDLVEHNYTRHWSVIEYADKLGISESYLHHLSARYLHLGPKTYIQNCLLAKAETLLVSQRTITEVADDLGFDHPGHFSRFIKNMTGVRPGKLKEKLRTMAIKS